MYAVSTARQTLAARGLVRPLHTLARLASQDPECPGVRLDFTPAASLSVSTKKCKAIVSLGNIAESLPTCMNRIFGLSPECALQLAAYLKKCSPAELMLQFASGYLYTFEPLPPIKLIDIPSVKIKLPTGKSADFALYYMSTQERLLRKATTLQFHTVQYTPRNPSEKPYTCLQTNLIDHNGDLITYTTLICGGYLPKVTVDANTFVDLISVAYDEDKLHQHLFMYYNEDKHTLVLDCHGALRAELAVLDKAEHEIPGR